MNEPKVNDGKGIFDTNGFIDSLVLDVNALVGDVISGKYIQFCSKAVEIIQKLTELKKGVAEEQKALSDQIKELRRFMDDVNAAEGGGNV